MFFTSIRQKLLDFITPEFCFLCDVFISSTNERFPFCEHCNLNQYLQVKKDFLNAYPIYSLGKYDGLLEKTIKRLKIKKIKDSIPFWAEQCVSLLKKEKIYIEVDYITSVPISKRRLFERGFNQSQVLAIRIAMLVNKPYVSFLKRIRHDRPQMTLGRKERLVNVCGAYAVREDIALANKKILLIDDVMTTGATLKECITTIKKREETCSFVNLVLARA